MSPIALYCAITGAINAITSLVLGIYVITTNPRSLANRTFFGFAMSVGLWGFCYTFWQTSSHSADALTWIRWVMAGAIFIPTFFIHFVVTLLGLNAAKRNLIRLSYVLSVIFLLSDMTPLFASGVVPRSGFPFWPVPGIFFHPFLAHFAASVVYGHYLMYRELQKATGSQRNQIKYVALGTLIGFGGGATNFPLWYGIPIAPVGNGLVALYVAMMAYSIARYRLLDINVALTRVAIFILLYIPLLLFPLVLSKSAESTLAAHFGPSWWMLPMALEALFAAGGLAIYRVVRQKAEDRLLAEQREYQAALRRASEGMTRIRELPRLLRLTVGILSRTVGLTHVSIYLLDEESRRYVERAAKGKEAGPINMILDLDDSLIKFLQFHRTALVSEELRMQRQQTDDPVLREIEGILRRLGAALIIPSFVHDHLLGFVVMGAKRSGKMYTDDDLKVLMTLANQAALAIENAHFYEAEKERQAEMFHTAQLASLGTMAGSMGHQINNRFHAETILAGLLRSMWEKVDVEAFPEQFRDLVQRTAVTFKKIEDDAARGGDIVKTLLDFSKPGKQDRISLSKVIETAKDLAQYRVKFEEIDYEITMEDPLPEINGNRNQLAEAFFNLMANGYDAMQAKAEAIQEGRMKMVGNKPYRGKLAITVTASSKNGETWIQAVVRDTGTGIKEDDLSRLFVPFFTTKATAEKGTGLGLYVIKRIIENHGGKIEVSSISGEGTTFAIRLPGAGVPG